MRYFNDEADKRERQKDFVTTVHITKAIQLLANHNSNLNNEQCIELLVANGINKQEATEIFLFLPIAFVRQWLTSVNWLDTYIEYRSEQKQFKRKFSETTSYRIINVVTQNYFQNSPDKDTILKIGGRSAEFHAINQLLNNHPNARLQEIKLSPTVIMR